MEIKETAIKTEKLTKRFGKRIAVDNLSIEIMNGELFSLLGTNGAGKTTTIKMLSCLMEQTSGKATVHGYSINDKPLKIKQIIGVSPQETAIAGHLSSKENLLLIGGVFCLNKGESTRRASHLMDLLEIEDRTDQARKLSGGLQRRLSIAMALMSDPRILFLDEPTLGLDPHARRSVWKYIEKLKGDKTILLTTHYLEEADELADTIAIMDNGLIIETGTSSALKQRYAGEQILSVTGDNLDENIAGVLSASGYKVNLLKGRLEIASTKPDIYYIVDILRDKGIIITGLNMKEPTLDDVFLKLTDKEVRI